MIDRFGNAITNLFGLHAGFVSVNARRVEIRRTYAEAAVGEPVAVVGSTGFIEIAVRDGNAAEKLALARGSSVCCHPERSERSRGT